MKYFPVKVVTNIEECPVEQPHHRWDQRCLGQQLQVSSRRYVQAWLSLVELRLYCALIGPELQSDKEPAQGTQNPLLGAFLISYLSLVLYGIKR